ncbi:MAG: hypothetical protein CUN56_09385 [Phototrophicales bacterium]|nr:MAG: hypothetical protein CUN56_09385 [Phototrophicales bacterium]
MPANVIQANYETLESVAGLFDNCTTITEDMLRQVLSKMDDLRPNWIGRGADAFFGEMENDVLPQVRRLVSAFEESTSTTQRIIEVLQEAEERASGLFNGNDSIVTAGTGGGIGNTGSAVVGQNGYLDYRKIGNVDYYKVRIDDPNFNPREFVASLNPGDRPVIFVVHGFNDNGDAYPQFAEHIDKQYGGQRPLVVGVEWDSVPLTRGMSDAALAGGIGGAVGGGLGGGVPGAIGGGLGGAVGAAAGTGILNYQQAEANARTYGPNMGQLIAAYNYTHPNSPVNVVAHSLGNGLVMEGIATNDVKINSYIAVQGAVDQAQIAPGGRYEDVLDTNEVGNLGVTYHQGDRAVGVARPLAGFDTGLGTHGGGENLQRPVGTTSYYNLDDSIPWYKEIFTLNHYSYNDEVVQNTAMIDMWGQDGSGLRGQR